MSTRQDAVDERLSLLEDKLQTLQVSGCLLSSIAKFIIYYVFKKKQEQIEALPELIARTLQQHQERADQRRNFLHPDAAATGTSSGLPTPAPPLGSPLLLPHSR